MGKNARAGLAPTKPTYYFCRHFAALYGGAGAPKAPI